MKVFHWFLGLCFLISIANSQSVEAASPVPAGLQSAIERVKNMKRSGASKKDIAAYVTRTVANRVTFLNHNSKKIDSVMGDAEIKKQLKRFDAFWDKGNLASDEFSAATWVWVNRIGQCNEGANTAFHILVMAYESINEILILNKGDHRFVILGDIKDIPNPFSPDDLRKLDDTYIVDPWDGKSFSTKDLSFFDWFQHGQGNRVDEVSYGYYMSQYNKWLTWCKKNPVEYRKWLHGESDTEAEEIVEHEKTMKSMLAQYQKEINKLKALKEQILQKGKSDLEKIQSNMWEAVSIQRYLQEQEALILSLVDQGKNFCDEARLLHQKIIALSAAMEDGETLVNTKINLAKDRKANCKTDEDGVFIKNNYQAAQDALAIMKKAKEGAFERLVEINIKLEQIKKIDVELSKHDSDAWKETRRKHEELLEEIPQYLDQLRTGLQDAKGFPGKVQELKNKIEGSKQHYIQYFPGAEAEFDKLINKVNSIRLYYVIDLAGLSDLSQEYQTAQTALDTPTRNDSRLFMGAPPLVNCFTNAESKKIMDKIDETFLGGLFAIKANEHLSTGCRSVSSVPPKKKPSKKSDTSKIGGTPSPNIADTTPDDTPPKSVFGGLIIGGPSKISVGQGAQFTALDGGGDPYPAKGSFAWINTREDIMVLSKSGTSAHALGFKPGSATIILKYEGMTAYRDIKIIEKENSASNQSDDDLIGTSGGEVDDSDANDDKIGTSGGDVDQNNQLSQQCSELIDLIVWSLNRNDTDAARNYTNRALALGCNVNASAVAGEIANINKTNQEQERTAQNHQPQGQAQRPQQSQNQTNWMDVMGTIIKGVQDIQQGHKKPPKKTPTLSTTSDPFPSSGTTFPPIPTDSTPTYYPGTGTGSGGGWGAGSQTTNTEESNKCGRIVPKEKLTKLRNAYKIKAKNWSHVAGYDYMYGPSGWIHYLNIYLAEDKYEKNVESWKKAVNCVDGCVSAYPKGTNIPDHVYRQFKNCVRKCKLTRCSP
ncbi:MAG: hypothetical protein PF690_08045 [Deltaproteobacteria bacterium]|nr:hypothetical protein [Deltaproteobacteria bacterium]